MSEQTHETVKGPGKDEKLGPKKKNTKLYIVGALALIAALVFFFVRKSNSGSSTASTTATPPTTSDGLDPGTLSTLESLGLLGNSSSGSGSSGYGGYSGSWWGGGGQGVTSSTPTAGTTSSGSTTSPTGTSTTPGSTATGTSSSPVTGSPLPGSSGAQLEYTTTGGQTLAQIAAALGTTTQTLIADTINGHGDVNNGVFSKFLSSSNMGAKGNVPKGLKLFYTPSK